MRGAEVSLRDDFYGMKIRNRKPLLDYKPAKPSNIQAQFNTEAICENNWGQGQSNTKRQPAALILDIELLESLAQAHRKTPGWCN
jgi:hypothetical protein